MIDEIVNNEIEQEQQSADDASKQLINEATQSIKKPTKDPAESFRELREKTDRIERERDEAVKRLQELQKAKEIDLAPDDIAEGKHVNQIRNEINQVRIENRIRSTCPNFESIVTKENIETLKTLKPGIARLLETSTDMETIAIEAYNYIKEYVIEKPDAYEDDKKRAQVNAAKPKPLASVSPQQGDSPLSHANAFANGLTDDLKRQLLKEMYDARKAM